jgi:hypothetical protein
VIHGTGYWLLVIHGKIYITVSRVIHEPSELPQHFCQENMKSQLDKKRQLLIVFINVHHQC